MSIITISRGSYSRGKEVAEKLAQRLGYDGGGPRCLDSLMGGLSSESVFGFL